MIELRPYQKTAIDKIMESFEDCNSTMLVLFTGGGKTIIAGSIIDSFVKNGKRVLFLAHREELLQQAKDKFLKFFGLESTLIKHGEKTDMSKQVFIGSVQSLCKDERLEKFSKEFFDLIITDEAHHCHNDTYVCIYDYFRCYKHLGITATPSDKKALSSIFESTAFEYNMEDAIKDCWLCPIVMRVANVTIDISKVRSVAGDFVLGELDEKITKQLKRVSRYIKNNLSDRKRILIFTPRVESAEIFARVLQEDGLSADFVCGKSKNRKDVTEKFRTGELRIVTNANLYSEGFDLPEIDCVINLRPSQSNTLVVQQMGRGTRICRDKKNLLIVDFIWNTDKKIITPCTVFAPNEAVEVGMKDFLIQKINSTYDLSNLAKYIYLAVGGLAKMEGARLKTLNELFKKGIKSYETIAFVAGCEKLLYYEDIYYRQTLPPTEKQVKFIQDKCGISCDGINRGKATQIIDYIVSRIIEKKCSIKQMLFLASRGLFDKAESFTMEQASQIMSATAKNYWRIPTEYIKKFGGDSRLRTPLMRNLELNIKSEEEINAETAEIF